MAFFLIYLFIHYLCLSAGSLATACAHHLNDSIHPTHNLHAAHTASQTDAEPAWLGFWFHAANHTHPAFAPQPALDFSIPASHNLKHPFHRLLHIQSMLPTNDFCPRPLVSTMHLLLTLAGKCPTPLVLSSSGHPHPVPPIYHISSTLPPGYSHPGPVTEI